MNVPDTDIAVASLLARAGEAVSTISLLLSSITEILSVAQPSELAVCHLEETWPQSVSASTAADAGVTLTLASAEPDTVLSVASVGQPSVCVDAC
jgi:hypothetical protein